MNQPKSPPLLAGSGFDSYSSHMTETNPDSSTLEQADEFVADYDKSALKYGWHTPELLFGLMYEYLESGHTLLDLGIGTGLSAVPFARAGIEVHGLDGSRKMLNECAAKNITVELKQHDIRSTPVPYGDGSFDHVIASGVFHLIGGLPDVFREAARVMRGGGAYAFSVELLEAGKASTGTLVSDGVLEIRNKTSGVLSYLQSHSLIHDLLNRNGFTIEKTLDYVAYRKTDWADERSFRAYIARQTQGT